MIQTMDNGAKDRRIFNREVDRFRVIKREKVEKDTRICTGKPVPGQRGGMAQGPKKATVSTSVPGY
jgi:hypothetical protein